MKLSSLEYCSLLTYCPRGDSEEIQRARNIMHAIKGDRYVDTPPVLMSQWIAKTIAKNRTNLPFASYFQPDTILVPVPNSSLMQPDTLWVPHRIADALMGQGLGREVVQCLARITPVNKSATSQPSQRPTPQTHYESLAVQGRLSEPRNILLVDDIITRGSTILGSANRLADLYPQANIKAFAAMRTMSNATDFKNFYDSCVGTIQLRQSGDTLRRP
ncbi:TPA: phosphoribosyltransferase [Candidatus Bathyarchaeota archaeon]|nr:phosphoribosyltransferase [Candidatus Bathyarchaeota archaeon]